MKAFAMNILIAVFWLFLIPGAQIVDFVFGFGIGFAMMALFRDVLDCREYVRRSLAFVKFVFVFLKEYLLANWNVTVLVLTKPASRMRPGMIHYDVEGLSPAEILMLSHVISLTPGSTTVEIDADFRRLLLHLFDSSDPDAARRDITLKFRDGILAFTRPALREEVSS